MRVSDQGRPGLPAPGDDIHDTRRELGGGDHLGQHICIERGLGRRLHDDSAAGGQGGGHANGQQSLGGVPRHDYADDTDRLTA